MLKSVTPIETAYERKERELLSGINFDRLSQLMSESIKQIAPAKDKDLVLFVGRTEAGKSTTLNYLMGSRIMPRRGRLELAEGEVEHAKIGHRSISETLYCTVVPLETSGDLAFCDCPGFDDNRMREEKLCSSISLPMVIAGARSVRALLVHIHYDDLSATRAEGLLSLVDTLSELLKDPIILAEKSGESNPFLFIFTHVRRGKTTKHITEFMLEKETELTKSISDLNNERERIIHELALLLGVSKEWAEATSEIEKKDLLNHIIETASLAPESSREYHLNERLNDIQCELIEKIASVNIMKLMLANKESFYIIRGVEADDKEKILTHISRLAGHSIAKENFSLAGSKNSEWSYWNKVIHKIVSDGAELLTTIENAPRELVGLKQYKKLNQPIRNRQEIILQTLKTHDVTSEELSALREEILGIYYQVLHYLTGTVAEKEAEQRALETELASLDTAEPTRYHHPGLKEVDLSVSASRCIASHATGITLGLITVIPALVNIALLIAMNVNGKYNPSGDHTGIGAKLFSVNKPFVWLVQQIGAPSHRFIYNDLPFLEAVPVIKGWSRRVSEYEEYRDGVLGLKKSCHFDEKSLIEDKAAGKYEITCTNWDLSEPDGGYREIALIELFIEKRIHPDIAPRIAELKRRLERARLIMSGYLRPDIESLNALFEREKELLKKGEAYDDTYVEPQTHGNSVDDSSYDSPGYYIRNVTRWRQDLIAVLEKRLAQHKIRMDRLQEGILGYKSSIRDAENEFLEKAPQFAMIAHVASAVGASEFEKDFLRNYTEKLAMVASARSDKSFLSRAVWGSKQARDVQPPYQMLSASVDGHVVRAEFGLPEKSSAAHWIGVLDAKPAELAADVYAPVSEGVVDLMTRSLITPTPEQELSPLRQLDIDGLASKLLVFYWYDYLMQGEYYVAKTRLAKMPIENSCTKKLKLTKTILKDIRNVDETPLAEGVYFLSKSMETLHPLRGLTHCIIEGEVISFALCVSRHKFPEWVEMEGRRVPLKGLMELLAVARLLGDVDVLGEAFDRVGYLIERDAAALPIAIRIVKIHADRCTDLSKICDLASPKDIRYSQTSAISWQTLSTTQKMHFLCMLHKAFLTLNSIRRADVQVFSDELTRKFSKDMTPLVQVFLGNLSREREYLERIYEPDIRAFNVASSQALRAQGMFSRPTTAAPEAAGAAAGMVLGAGAGLRSHY